MLYYICITRSAHMENKILIGTRYEAVDAKALNETADRYGITTSLFIRAGMRSVMDQIENNISTGMDFDDAIGETITSIKKDDRSWLLDK